jgi:SAM-dependent methyltransferase
MSEGIEAKLIEQFGSKYVGNRKLHAGCGHNKLPGWVNLDGFIHQQPNVVADLNRPLPFLLDTFDTILCTHTLEHVADPMFTVHEFNRVLKVGGFLIVVVPHAFGQVGLANPLHVNYFTDESFQYFLKGTYARGDAGEGAHQNMPLGDWRIDRTELVPYPAFLNHPNLPFLANHCFNIIHEVRAILEKV